MPAALHNKKNLTEADIRTKFITPAIEAAGWDKVKQMREEYYFTAGRIIVRGKLVARGKGVKVDYLLYASGQTPIAVVEAKDNEHEVAGGMQQALGYVRAKTFVVYDEEEDLDKVTATVESLFLLLEKAFRK